MRLVIISDSLIFKNIIKDIFKSSSSIVIVGEVSNWNTLIIKLDSLLPDLLISDSENMNWESIKSINSLIVFITKKRPLLTSSNMLYIPKPELLSFNDMEYRKSFFETIKNFFESKIKSVTKPHIFSYSIPHIVPYSNEYKILLIGASTGGPVAVASVLKGLKRDFPLGIVIVQHIETGFDVGYASWLSDETGWKVRLAKDNDFPTKREAILAPTDKHLVFRGTKVFLDDGPKVLNQKPSIDVLFESAAPIWGKQLIAILLTGMGSDGAEGCLKIKSSGGVTLVQDKETSTIFGMPKAAIEKGGASHILPLYDIPNFLENLVL